LIEADAADINWNKTIAKSLQHCKNKTNKTLDKSLQRCKNKFANSQNICNIAKTLQ
jgi:hypothetical protein